MHRNEIRIYANIKCTFNIISEGYLVRCKLFLIFFIYSILVLNTIKFKECFGVVYSEVGSEAYYFRMFLEQFFFYVIFFYLYKEVPLKKKIFFPIFLVPITFILQIFFEGFGDIVPMLGCYLSLKNSSQNKYVILNAVLISSILPYLISILISVNIIAWPALFDLPDFFYVLLEVLIELAFLIFLLYLARFIKLRTILYQYSSQFSALFFFFYYFSLQIFLYMAEYFQAYENFIFGIALFLIVQIIFLAIFLVREVKKQKENYEITLVKKQIDDFKMYTAKLEENQQNLRKFKHDYNNIILSFKESMLENNHEMFEKQINVVEGYSEKYFTSMNWQYNDVENLENVFLKSFFISKFYTMQEYAINFHFECMEKVNEVPIRVLDLVRIIGISIDNAIEAAKEIDNSEINIVIYQDSYQLEVIIENTYQWTDVRLQKFMELGYSSKEGHLGLGLSNIQEIKKKYSNVYVQYQKTEDKFSVQIILTFERLE